MKISGQILNSSHRFRNLCSKATVEKSTIAARTSNFETIVRKDPSAIKFIPTSYALADQVFDETQPSSKCSYLNKIGHKKHNNGIFPWRHSPHKLPRLITNTDEEYEEGGEFGPRFPMRSMNAAERALLWFHSVFILGLRRPWLYASWKRDLEDGFLSAFAMGLQGVLVDVYQAPTSSKSDNERDDGKTVGESNDEDINYNVYINHTIVKPMESSDSKNSDSNTIEIDEDSEKGGKRYPHKSTSAENYQQSEERQNIDDMLEASLQSLYHSAHSSAKSKLNIHLECEPKSANLLSLFTIPLLTREEVKQTPSLQSLYPDFHEKLSVKALEEMQRSNGRDVTLSWRQVYEEMKEFVEEKLRKQDDEGVIQMTVVAQALIECDELFYVRDVTSGKVIQGNVDGKKQEVLHLVRFEMVVDWDWQRNELHTGNWQITDWDDLLDGNIYYL